MRTASLVQVDEQTNCVRCTHSLAAPPNLGHDDIEYMAGNTSISDARITIPSNLHDLRLMETVVVGVAGSRWRLIGLRYKRSCI